MPIKYHIDPDANLITFRLIGDYRLDEARLVWREVFDSKLYRKGMNSLWDMRHGTLRRLTKQGALAVRDATMKADKLRGHYKLAIAVVTEVDYGMARMLTILCDEAEFESQVFRGYDEAVQWLSEPSSPQDP